MEEKMLAERIPDTGKRMTKLALLWKPIDKTYYALFLGYFILQLVYPMIVQKSIEIFLVHNMLWLNTFLLPIAVVVITFLLYLKYPGSLLCLLLIVLGSAMTAFFNYYIDQLIYELG